MLKQKFFISFCIGIFCILISCQNGFSKDINLDDFSSPIQISASDNSVKLTRGTYAYDLKKKGALNNKKYAVIRVDPLSYTSSHKKSPDDAYSRTLEIVSFDDQSAIRAIKFLDKGGDMEISDPADMAKAQQIMADVEHLNQAKFAIGILPADDSIRSISKRIREGSNIRLSGIHFKLSRVVNNGKQEPISHCLGSLDIFYVTDLKIE